MWIADGWKDYELLDCGGGEKLEKLLDYIPDSNGEQQRKIGRAHV